MDGIGMGSNYKSSQRSILTYTGKFIDIFDAKPEDFCVKDIAHHLALRNRFTGASTAPYSVAQHCCLAAMFARPPLDRRIALLHDAEEAYVPDIPGPFKIERPWKEVDKLGCTLRHKIWEKYLGWNNTWVGRKDGRDSYQHIDHQLLIVEIRTLVSNWQNTWVGNDFLELAIEIIPWTWQEAEIMFLRMAELLGIKD